MRRFQQRCQPASESTMGREIGEVAGPVCWPACAVAGEGKEISGGSARGGGRRVRGS